VNKLSPKVIVIRLLVVVIVPLHATISLASPGILASSGKGGNWEIYLIDPATGDAKNLTNDPGDD
jgi:hypothetical protein